MAKRKHDTGDGSRSTGDDPVAERLRRHLAFLGLTHTLDQIEELLAWAMRERPGPTALLEHVLGTEAARKLEQRIARRIDHSDLPERKTLETFDWAFQPKLDKSFVLELGRLDFVLRHDDLVITGKSGTGKSHILQALALRACEREIRVRYTRCVDLIDDLYAGLADHTYDTRLRRWARAEWLVIDDVGLGQLRRRDDEPTAAHMLFNLLDSRHEQAPTAITSNIKLGEWGKYLGDATLAAAILDRLAMTSIRIDIDGPSYRDYLARRRAKDHGIVDDAA
jgi:DNA replication protein DnaC